MITNKNEINANALSDEQLENVSGGYLYFRDPVGEGLLEVNPFTCNIGQEVNVLADDNKTYRAKVIDRRIRVGMNLRIDVQYKVDYIDRFYYDEWVFDYLIS